VTLLILLKLVGGLAILTFGAEYLVRGAAALARAMNISPLVIGLTVVAFGTSTPELVVSCLSAWNGQPDMAIGNVVGSNIFNILLILGLSAIIVPLSVNQQLVRFDVPLMIGLSILVLLFGLDSNLSRIDGLILVAGLFAYVAAAIVQSRRANLAIKAEYEAEFGGDPQTERQPSRVMLDLVFLIAGLGMLIGGSHLFLDAGVTIARFFGVSELVIGLTLVAVGTSLPEAATSLMAAYRGERDIAVGNAVGSNIFNILAVLGISSVIAPSGIAVNETALQFDLPVMIAVAVACFPIFLTGHEISRWEGFVFVFYFIAYTTYLILRETKSVWSGHLSEFMMLFVIPLTVLTMIVSVVHSLRAKSSPEQGSVSPQ
jgi:cation:H+ antiporter